MTLVKIAATDVKTGRKVYGRVIGPNVFFRAGYGYSFGSSKDRESGINYDPAVATPMNIEEASRRLIQLAFQYVVSNGVWVDDLHLVEA